MFSKKVAVFKLAPRVAKYLGYNDRKFVPKTYQKAQFGHTTVLFPEKRTHFIFGIFRH